jgi:hypothetical protein
MSAIARGEDEALRGRGGNLANGLLMMLNTPRVPVYPMMFDDHVTLFDKLNLSQGEAAKQLDQLRRPGTWNSHDDCAISQTAVELRADCIRLYFDGSKLAQFKTRYAWKKAAPFGLRSIANAEQLWPN